MASDQTDSQLAACCAPLHIMAASKLVCRQPGGKLTKVKRLKLKTKTQERVSKF